MLSQKIYFDLTTSWRHRGRPPVGITRCERVFGKGLFAAPELPVSFCVYNSAQGGFFKLDECTVGHILDNTPINFNSGSHIVDEDRLTTWSPLTLSRGDVYVNIGLIWDQFDLSRLYIEKRRIGFKSLFFCYDLIPILLPHFCVPGMSIKFQNYFLDLCWTADEIICISEASRADLQSFVHSHNAPMPRTSVIRLGSDLALWSAAWGAGDGTPSAPDCEPYVLCVGTIEARKNHALLFNIWCRLLNEGVRVPDLVLVGSSGWRTGDLLQQISDHPVLSRRIRVVHNLQDDELIRLYQNCLFSVYPSFYEGWGLPVGESLSFGKYCLCSNTSSLPEVAEGLAGLLDPLDFASWYRAIKGLLHDPDELRLHEQRIRETYKPTLWEHSAAFFRKRVGHVLQVNDGVSPAEPEWETTAAARMIRA